MRFPTILLIAGHWLGAWAWDEVLPHLPAAHYRALAITLPGLDPDDPDRASRTLTEQSAAIIDALRSAGVPETAPATIVAHSGANAPVSVVLDTHPDLVHRVVWVDSGPMVPGTAFAPDFPAELTELPLPAFDELAEQASSDGLSTEALERFRARAVPQPGPVLRQRVELFSDARHRVPTTLLCCSMPGTVVRELVQAGHPVFAEVALLTEVDVVDLPTGHWPMWSRPAELAAVIAAADGRIAEAGA